MPKPLTPEELQQLQDAIEWKAERGQDVGILPHVLALGVEQQRAAAGETDNTSTEGTS